MSKTVKRLFEQFKPEHYNIALQLDKENMSFSGSVTIKGQKVGRPSQRLTFHQKELSIQSAMVIHHSKNGDSEVKLARINRHNAYDEIRLHSDALLYPGSYTVTLVFNGTITRPMNGIYPCYFTHDNKEEVLLATQFESHHAREAFPCIDEPEAKATFDLTLTTPKGEQVIANTPIKQQRTKGKSTTTTFETTPKMSSYLLAFVTGNLAYQERKTKDGTAVRAYARPDKVNQTDFALDVAIKSLEFYNEYFAIPYPLEKCDLIALPDFAAGAMENWGCITFREQCMLVDPQNTSLPTKQYVAMVMAHELAHQWFGNLVTMRWWTDLWLNEGFASWVEYLAVDRIFPDWRMWEQFITDDQQAALKLDALEHTHPIEVPVKHPDEIRTIFDVISYSKGASVIHMLNQYLGSQLFRDGLRYYLKEHAYGNTDTTDLWQALETISGKPVKDFMNVWTGQPGYPVVHAVINDQSIELRQESFYLNRNQLQNKQSSVLWPVPLLTDHAEVPELLTKEQGAYSAKRTDSLKFNNRQSGFYRVAYNASHLHRLSELVHRGKFSALDRLGILSDAFETAKAGYADTDDALGLLQAYSNEDSPVVWDIIAGNIGELRLVMNSDELREAMKPFIIKITKTQLKRLGWKARKDELHFDKLLRPIILGLAAGADEPAIVAACKKRFSEMKKPEDIEPDLRGIIYGTVARHGSQAEFDRFVKLHNQSTNSEERNTYAAALTGFKQKNLTKKALALVKTDKVRLQDAAYWIAYSFSNRWGRDIAWEWVKDNWDWLEKNLGNDLSFYRFPVYIARVFSESSFLKEYRAFFEPLSSPALERSIKQGVEIIEWHSDWKKRDYKEVLAFFKAQSRTP